MSGTSLDGIDVAVIDIAGVRIKTLAHATKPWPKAVTRARILAVSNTQCSTRDISRLNFELGELYAKAFLEIAKPHRVELIGCHGQTIFHEGTNTLQIGEASVIAERTGIPVISDFRTRDIAAGGQGAPLVPFTDYLLFRNKRINRVALNIGGIANITVLPAGAPESAVIAFDTGPGNMVIDQPRGTSTRKVGSIMTVTAVLLREDASTGSSSILCSKIGISRRSPPRPRAANNMARNSSKSSSPPAALSKT